MHAQFGDAGHSENIRPFRNAEFFAEPFRTSAWHVRARVYICIYGKRNGILKIESPRLTFYARAQRRITKARGAISFICNETGASGATHITDVLSSLFGKAELFSILRHFALSINHPRACLSHALLLFFSLSVFLSFALILSWRPS